MGGAITVTDSFGADVIRSDRIPNIGTADNENAFIALVESSYDEVPNNAFQTVAHLTNNLGDDVTAFNYEISTNQNGVSIRFNGEESGVGGTLTGTINLAEGGAEPVDLECSQPGQIDEGSEVLTVQINEVQSATSGVTIQGLSFDQGFVCTGGPVLVIDDVRGLANSRSFEYFEPEVDVEETENAQTVNLSVRLTITGDTEGTVFDVTKEAPADFDDIANETLTVPFDVGQLNEDTYTYTVEVDADNATRKTVSDTFVVDDELLIIDLAGGRTGARSLAVDALNRSGEDVDLVAVAVEHDPDGETNRNRTEFETLEIDVGGDGTVEVSQGGKNDMQPGDGTRIDHSPLQLVHEENAEYTFEQWDGGGNIKGETFEITIWAVDENGDEVATTDRVTVPN